MIFFSLGYGKIKRAFLHTMFHSDAWFFHFCQVCIQCRFWNRYKIKLLPISQKIPHMYIMYIFILYIIFNCMGKINWNSSFHRIFIINNYKWSHSMSLRNVSLITCSCTKNCAIWTMIACFPISIKIDKVFPISLLIHWNINNQTKKILKM